MNRSLVLGFALGAMSVFAMTESWKRAASVAPALPDQPAKAAAARSYDNTLRPIQNPKPLLADYPQFVEPVVELRRFESARLVDDADADLDVRAWRWSYNARGIIEMPNRLSAKETAVIMVHPWAVDDEWGWVTPEPNGVVDFCTPEKNALAARHTKEVIDPFLKRLRGKAAFIMFSLPGPADAIRTKVYRSFTKRPAADERAEGERELRKVLAAYRYRGEPLPERLTLSAERPVIDYFKQFPGLEAGPRFNGEGFWKQPIPVSTAVTVDPSDVVVFDAEGYAPLRDFLRKNGVRHVLLTGYATDMCFCKTTAGYENLSRDFNVVLVGDATLATFPANSTPRFATNAHISFAALNHLVTQVNWVKVLK
jgi:hypothetical protein